ncbi:MAG TPA: asparagine--tRNA ligase [Aminobacterium sp.]|jgi:asparaginyl-tRNA synthetase|uniref:asparagine--tRNA ligase n=1 Tax=Aminobacterium TaxID=81466 RepID=UPI000ED7B674|nr:asparagine--tRNA ligase [Aminobacterium sp. UBA4834]HCA41124.1 asparagine--tRNA ligase [Aminobacterium sp.]
MSAPWIYIKDLSLYEGQTVTVKGWMYNKRSSGKIHFLQLRDGTGTVQGVMVKNEVSEDDFEEGKRLWLEASVEVEGTVRLDTRAPSGVELTITGLRTIQNPEEEYPLGKKDHGIDFLLDHRHLWLRSSRQQAIMRIRERVIWSAREYLHKEGFMLIDSPILTGSIGEGAAGLFEMDYFEETKAYLAQTGQLYAEAAAAAFGKVYCFGPTFRAEKSKTRRHLTEFWMLEPEVAFYDHNKNIELQEKLVSYIVEQVLDNCRQELESLERDISKLERIKAPFYRITYDKAMEILHELGSQTPYGDDFGNEDETILTQQFDKPIFVECYPKKVKAFYMKEHPENPDLVLCDDLLAPEGYGEIIGGSQREDDLHRLLGRIHEEGLSEESYDWYLDLRKFGTFVHSGFGMGIERVVAWICGLDHIREAIPWPRTIYRIKP